MVEHVKRNPFLRLIQKTRANVLWQAVLTFLVVIIVVPATVYFFVVDFRSEDPEDKSTCIIEYNYRVPCGFTPGREMGNVTTAYRCRHMNCCYDDKTRTCFHAFPSKYGYKSSNDNLFTAKYPYTPLGNLMHKYMSIKVTSSSKYIEATLRTDVEPDETEAKTKELFEDNFPGVVYNISQDPLGVEIYREDYPKDKLLHTLLGPLIASDGYWEWTVELTNKNGTMYGLGGLKLEGNVSRVIHRNDLDHSNVPFFLAQHETPEGIKYHAMLVEHHGLLEVQVLESNLIILRAVNTTKTDGLTLRLFPGPTFDDILTQIKVDSDLVDETIPRWLLGTHICRNSVTDFQTMIHEFINDQMDNSLEIDSDCINEMLIIHLIEMYDDTTPEVRNNIRELIQKNLKTKFVLPLSPHIPVGVVETETTPAKEYYFYKIAKEKNVLLKNSTKHIQTGVYKNRKVVFLDPNAANAAEYLKLLLETLVPQSIPLENIEAVFLLDNWPQDNSYNYSAVDEYLVYYNEEITMALNKTPGMLLPDQDVYVKQQIELVRDYFKITHKDIPILSASHYYQYNTPLYPQNLNKSWTNLKATTSRTIFSNMFTHPVSLNPVCGTDTVFNYTTHENELCAKWFINQATLPGQRLTTNWFTHKNFTLASRNIVQKALDLKKMLSYYQYTLLQDTGRVVKPLFVDFPNDNETWPLDEQYLLGNLVVVPIFLPEQTMKRYYLPVNYTWFEFWGGMNFQNGWHNSSISKDERMLFVKEGSLVPLLKNNDENDYFELLIARHCLVGRELVKGSIYYDTAELRLEFLDRFIHVTNIQKVRQDVQCQSKVRIHPYVFEKVKIYDCKHSVDIRKIAFDLCDDAFLDKDEFSIPLSV